ncbi:YqhA family protein [Devosia sp. A16]|uniref:YqhA family protein n=1 Tax=Devosia sp. A16 TaxID=1736675 RepID=UPI0006D7760C|nr:YqhA family protein [Devosia sp. A16]
MAEDMDVKSVKPRMGEGRQGQGPFVIGGFVVRVAMLVPVIALSVASVALIVYGAFETRHLLTALFGGHPVTRDEAILLAIEIVDLFLLATVVQVVSLGLYQLYFRQDLQLPRWLKIETLDDLKSKLVGVTITVLAVYFLGRAVVWETGVDILYLGSAVAVIIVALTYFLSKIDHD